MKKVCIVGHYGVGKNLLNGQTIKTKIVTAELEKQLGTDQIMRIDTHGGIKKLPWIILKLVVAFAKCQNIIILPAHNGVKIFSPLCVILNFLFHKRIHYVVIGGWINDLLRKRKMLGSFLKKFTGIYVETNTMKNMFNNNNFSNVFVLPNFKDIKILQADQLIYHKNEPFKFCTFSRVMKEKGIEKAIAATNQINTEYGRTVCILDIYGQIDSEQTDWFRNLEAKFNNDVCYKGMVPFDQSVSVLKEYYALLFPTEFYTEGIPGTIIDAYASGIPVISSKWESFDDIIEDNVSGYGYEFSDSDGLKKKMLEAIQEKNVFCSFKNNCIAKATLYRPEVAIKCLINNL